MGMQLVTHQTGPRARKSQVYLEEGCDIAR